MGKYLHLFNTETAFTSAYNGSDYLEPWVSYTDETQGQEHVDYNKSKKWDGSSVLDLTDIEHNPNLERKDPSYYPSGLDYDSAAVQDKYLFYKVKDFVLPGLTGENPTIQTIITDWEEWGRYTGDTLTATFIASFVHGGGQYNELDYNWGPCIFILNHGTYQDDVVPGYIWFNVKD